MTSKSNTTKLREIRNDAASESIGANTSELDVAKAFEHFFDKGRRKAFFDQIAHFLTEHPQGPQFDRGRITSIDFHDNHVIVWFYVDDIFNSDNRGEFGGGFEVRIETPRIHTIWNIVRRIPSRKERQLQLLARTLSDQLEIAKQIDMAGLEGYIARIEADLASVSQGQLPYYTLTSVEDDSTADDEGAADDIKEFDYFSGDDPDYDPDPAA